jgi:hypothetical protein
MKQKLVELAVDQAAELGIKMIALAGKALVELAEDLTEARIEREKHRSEVISLKEKSQSVAMTIAGR